MLLGLLHQQPSVVFNVNLAQQDADQPPLIDNVNECLILTCLDGSIVKYQHAYLLELNVVIRAVKHLVVQFATLSAVVFVLRELV